MLGEQEVQRIIRQVLGYSHADETEVVFFGQSSQLTRFANNHIDPEWTRVEQVVQGRWTARSSVVDPAKSAL